MSNISKILDRAVNDDRLENNTIGKLRISPQHGINCFSWNIYMDIIRKGMRDRINEHYATIGGVHGELTINHSPLMLAKDLKDIHATLTDNYGGWNIKIEQF